MTKWILSKVHHIPMILGLVFTMGLVICFLVAVLRGDVSPYMPFISETGAIFPEAGLFSIFMNLSAIMGLTTVLVRYMVVAWMNCGFDKVVDNLNRISIVLGINSALGMMVTGSYQMTSVPFIHDTGANTLFACSLTYSVLQTRVSYRMSKHYGTLAICRIRMAITIMEASALILMTLFMVLGMKEWDDSIHEHWTGRKTPEDQGFALLFLGSLFEWAMAFLFLAYYLTFIGEFRKVCIQVRIEPLEEKPANTWKEKPAKN